MRTTIAALNLICNSPATFSTAYYRGMLSKREMRRAMLRDLIDAKPFNGNQAEFARKIKKSPAQVNQWLTGHRALGDAGARGIELALNLDSGYFDGRSTPQTSQIDLSPSDKQTLSNAQYLPPARLDALIEDIRLQVAEKRALYTALIAQRVADETRELGPEPPSAVETQKSPRKGKPYKLPEPGIAKPHSGHHKKRVA